MISPPPKKRRKRASERARERGDVHASMHICICVVVYIKYMNTPTGVVNEEEAGRGERHPPKNNPPTIKKSGAYNVYIYMYIYICIH